MAESRIPDYRGRTVCPADEDRLIEIRSVGGHFISALAYNVEAQTGYLFHPGLEQHLAERYALFAGYGLLIHIQRQFLGKYYRVCVCRQPRYILDVHSELDVDRYVRRGVLALVLYIVSVVYHPQGLVLQESVRGFHRKERVGVYSVETRQHLREFDRCVAAAVVFIHIRLDPVHKVFEDPNGGYLFLGDLVVDGYAVHHLDPVRSELSLDREHSGGLVLAEDGLAVDLHRQHQIGRLGDYIRRNKAVITVRPFDAYGRA